MTITPTAAQTPLSEQVAEEIRGWMGKRRISGAQVARLLGVSQMWVSDRLRGATPINLNDLERIATALDVAVADLLPPGVLQRRPQPRAQTTGPSLTQAVRRRQMTIRHRAVPDRPASNRPTSHPPRGVTPPTSRRPVFVRKTSDDS